MPLAQLDLLDLNSIKGLSHLEYANKIISVAEAFLAHPGHQDPLPRPLIQPLELKEKGTYHIVLTNAAANGDRVKAAARDAHRAETDVDFVTMINWAVTRSVKEKDPSLIQNLTLDLKKAPAPKKRVQELVGAPTNPKVRHAGNGAVMLSCGKVKHAATYEVGYCTGDPRLEESWTESKTFTGCQGNKIEGLNPGQIYHFRIRCFGAAGQGPWSSVVTLMVI